MIFRIDPSTGTALFEQLTTQVRLGIANGDLVAGERLPSARELAESLDVNVHTVLKAYQLLRDEGAVELRRGRGAVVTGRAALDLTPLHAAIADVVREAARLGVSHPTVLTLVKEQLR